MICDFCSSPNVVSEYQAKDFPDPTLCCMSEGSWSGCPECSDLIDNEEWSALTQRSVDNYPHNVADAEELALLKVYMTELHKRFRENKFGGRLDATF